MYCRVEEANDTLAYIILVNVYKLHTLLEKKA